MESSSLRGSEIRLIQNSLHSPALSLALLFGCCCSVKDASILSLCFLDTTAFCGGAFADLRSPVGTVQ